MGNTYFNCIKSASSTSDAQIIFSNNLKVKATPNQLNSLSPSIEYMTKQKQSQSLLESQSQPFLNEELSTILNSPNYIITIDSVKNYFTNNNIPDISIDNSSLLSNHYHQENQMSKFTCPILFPKKNQQKTCLIQPLTFNQSIDINYKESIKAFIKAVIITSFNFEFTLPLQGYIVQDDMIFLVYPLITISLKELLTNDSLDFNNKIIIAKNIISALKVLNSNRLYIREFNADNIKFTDKHFLLKIMEIGLITDNSNYYKENIYSLGNILLNLFSNKITTERTDETSIRIENIYLKALIIGLIRKEIEDLPNIDDVIKVFNEFIKRCEYEHMIVIENDNDISKYQIVL